MASSSESPNTLRQLRAKAIWLELLPGIEEFLVDILARENLSSPAEEKRLYFVERLDILKLPPSIPPRPGRVSASVPVSEAVVGEVQAEVKVEEVLPDLDLDTTAPAETEPEDFAAYQREISRNLGVIPYTENSDAESEQGVKVYDDIDTEEHLDGQDDDDKDEQDLYEIPVARLQLSEDSAATGGNQSGGDRASLATAASIDDISEELADIPLPPPLPPRRDRAASDLTAEDKPPNLPARPPPRMDVYDKSNQSEKSVGSDDHTENTIDGGGDSTSYESYEEDNQYHDTELLNKLNIKLPKRPKKKQNKLKKKLSKSRSSSSWEINVPFKKLEDMALSGDLQYKGKLSWTRKLVALSNGNLAMYKPDKETKPQLVVHLMGYEASVHKDSRKGYEIKMVHPNCDSHIFSVDFREWAHLWMEHINNMAKGLPPPGPYQHLARTSFSGTPDHGGSKTSLDSRSATLNSNASIGGGALASPTTLARWDWKTLFYNWMFPIDHFIMGFRGPDLNASNSNLSTSSDGIGLDDGKARLRGNKVMRMGSFAYRATQFFESLGKKSGKRKMAGLSIPLDSDLSTSDIMEERSLSAESAPSNLSPLSDSNTPVFDDPDSPGAAKDVEVKVKHEGYLNIFSSFNRRRWGKRWCLVRENMFECYRNEKAKQYELNLLLKNCVLRRAQEETKSDLALMLLEDGQEKITVEALSQEEMGPWVHVLMAETATDTIPEGLEEYFVEDNHSNNSISDILGYSVIKSWEKGNVDSPSVNKVVSREGILEEEEEEEEEENNNINIVGDNNNNSATSLPVTIDNDPPKDVYTEVQKKGKNSSELSPMSPDDFEERKHTTDSGFYSVKGSNSDSESDSGCVLRSEDDPHSVSSPVTFEQRDLIPALSPSTKKKSDTSGLHIRFSLDTEEIVDKEEGSYDAIEVTVNESATECLRGTDPEDSSSHSDTDHMKRKDEVSDLDNTKCDDSIEISKCDMLNSSSDAETVKSSTASVVSLSDKLEQNASAVSSDSDEVEEESAEKQTDITDKVDSSENKDSSHGNKDNSSSSFHGNGKADAESAVTEPADVQSTSSVEEFDREIQRKIGRLREKLVQIKRKRIAVRDKRLRASSSDEERICDEEYSNLDQDCLETDEEISRLENELTNHASFSS